MKRFAKWGVVAVIVILLVCLLKYFGAGLGFTVDNGYKLALKVPNLAHLSRYLDGSEYQFNFKEICAAGFVVLLASLRFLFLRTFWV